jgi:phosphoglycolate phosphatase-like HAD superfamily hydrolase
MIKIKPNTIVFDFDGTIADTLNFQIDLYNTLAKKEGFMQINSDNLDLVKSKGMREVVKMAKIPMYKFPGMINQLRNQLARKINQAPLVGGIEEMLFALKKNYQLGILTSNRKDIVEGYLKDKKLDVFDFVYSALNMFGKDKVIKKMLKEQDLRAEEVLYIGDEVRDIEACQKCGLPIVAVSWGFNNRQALEDHGPDYLIDRPAELLEIL